MNEYELLDHFTIRVANASVDKNVVDKYIKEKIYVASKSMYESMTMTNEKMKIQHTINKYVNRARYRTTPFGIFTSLSFFENYSSKKLGEIILNEEYGVYCKIHPEWMYNFLNKVKKNYICKLKVQCNRNAIKTTPYKFYNFWPVERYESYITVPYDGIIARILENAERPIDCHELVTRIEKYYQSSISKETLKSIILFLVDNGFIVTELDDICYYKNPEELVNFLKSIDFENESIIYDIVNNIKNQDSSISNVKISNLSKLEEKMQKVVESNNYIYLESQVNFKKFEININEVENMLQPLVRFMSSYAKKKELSSRYMRDVNFFLEEFGTTKVKFIDFYQKYDAIRKFNIRGEEKNDECYEMLRNKFIEHIQVNGQESFDISVLEKDIQQMTSNLMESSICFQLYFFLCRYNDRVKLIFSPLTGNNGLGRMEGRFEYMNLNYISYLHSVERNIYKDANIGEILIQIFPQNSRNVLLMNNDNNIENITMGLYDNELSLDLNNVYISVDNNRFLFHYYENGSFKNILFTRYDLVNIYTLAPTIIEDILFWSKNYFNDIFKVFDDLDKVRKEFNIIPEITYQDIIIYNKSWCIKCEKHVFKNKSIFFEFIKNMKEKYKIEDLVFARIEDRGFLIDLNNFEEVEYIYEMYFSHDEKNVYFESAKNIINNSFVKDKDNNVYLAEIGFNIKKRNVEKVDTNKFPIYSKESRIEYEKQWEQINIYIKNDFQIDFLKGYIRQMLEEINITYENFFYIRYSDGREHIRLRFRRTIKKEDMIGIEKFLKKATNEVIQYGTYIPEIERYGGNDSINLAENFFGIDSLLCIDIMSSDNEDEGIYIFLTAKILDAFFKTYDDKLSVVEMGYSNKEFSKEYRDNRNKYEQYFDMAHLLIERKEIAEMLEIDYGLFNKWETILKDYILTIENNYIIKRDIARSLIHMMCIRRFGIYSNEEKLILNVVYRIIKSKIVRTKVNNPASVSMLSGERKT